MMVPIADSEFVKALLVAYACGAFMQTYACMRLYGPSEMRFQKHVNRVPYWRQIAVFVFTVAVWPYVWARLIIEGLS